MGTDTTPGTIRLGNLMFEWDSGKRGGIPGMAVSVMTSPTSEDGGMVGWAEPVREADWLSFVDAQPTVTKITLEEVDDFVPVQPGGAILVDAVGARAVALSSPEQDKPVVGLIFDLAGKRNKLDERAEERFILPVAIAAEIVAEFVVAANMAAETPEFAAEFGAALQRHQERLMRERMAAGEDPV